MNRIDPSTLTQDSIKYLCTEMDHIDPDTQPDETGA